jgi:hypothetical protein
MIPDLSILSTWSEILFWGVLVVFGCVLGFVLLCALNVWLEVRRQEKLRSARDRAEFYSRFPD